jgi:hypothetical protein
MKPSARIVYGSTTNHLTRFALPLGAERVLDYVNFYAA